MNSRGIYVIHILLEEFLSFRKHLFHKYRTYQTEDIVDFVGRDYFISEQFCRQRVCMLADAFQFSCFLCNASHELCSFSTLK